MEAQLNNSSSQPSSPSLCNLTLHGKPSQVLPPEIFLDVIEYLGDDPVDLLSVSMACTAWYQLTFAKIPKAFSASLDDYEWELADVTRFAKLLATTRILGLHYQWTSVHIRIALKVFFGAREAEKCTGLYRKDAEDAYITIFETLVHPIRHIHFDFAELSAPPPQLSLFFSRLQPLCNIDQLTIENYSPVIRNRELSEFVHFAAPTLTHIHLRNTVLDRPVQSALSQCHRVSHARFTSTYPSHVVRLIQAWSVNLRFIQISANAHHDTVPMTIATACPNLESLEFSPCDCAPAVLGFIVQQCRELRSLVIMGHANDVVLGIIAQGAPNLTQLKLPRCRRIRGRLAHGVSWPALTLLDLRECDLLERSFVTIVLDACPQLKELVLPTHLLEEGEGELDHILMDVGFQEVGGTRVDGTATYRRGESGM